MRGCTAKALVVKPRRSIGIDVDNRQVGLRVAAEDLVLLPDILVDPGRIEIIVDRRREGICQVLKRLVGISGYRQIGNEGFGVWVQPDAGIWLLGKGWQGCPRLAPEQVV